MAISDVQLKDESGNWNSLFPISVAHGGTGATNAVAACRSIDAVRYDSTSSTSQVTDAVISAKSDSNQPIRFSVDGAAGSYTLYFSKDGTIGFWDNDQAKTVWAIKFPVGYVYISFSTTSPAALFGGTWSQISGRFLYCTNSTSTGGSNNAIVVSHKHTASTNTTGSHTHDPSGGTHWGFPMYQQTGGVTRSTLPQGRGGEYTWQTYTQSELGFSGTTASAGAHSHTVTVNSTGNSATNANMPSYQGVYAWRKTA